MLANIKIVIAFFADLAYFIYKMLFEFLRAVVAVCY